MLKSFWHALEIKFTIKGKTPQYHRIADTHDITIMYGKTPKANVSNKDLYTESLSEGGYPNTKLAPSTVAFCKIVTPLPSNSKKLIINGTFNSIAAKISCDKAYYYMDKIKCRHRISIT